MKHPSRRLIPALLCLVLVFGGFGCKVTSKEAAQRSQPLTLKWWTVFGDYNSIAPLLTSYRSTHPNISIDFRKLTYDEYENAILNAMAEDRGPDIISLHGTWLRQWQDRLLPAPSSVSMAFTELKGSIKKEEITVIRQVPIETPKQVLNDYIDTVGENVILPQVQSDPRLPPVSRLYALPLSTDTLVLYYNKDILDEAGIAQPAQYWSEFQEHVKRLTQLDDAGNIIQAGTALGTSKNIDRAEDILALLMMQNGTQMTDSSGSATFDRFTPETAGQPLPPGGVALVFYNDFANPLKEVYTWNENMPDGLTAFADGKVAYWFGYAYHLPQIRAKKPNLNFGITPFPQIEGNKPVNFANYWVEAVSAKTKYQNESWDLLNYITQADQAKKYLASARLPTALRQLVNSQLEDANLSVFASQLPSAKSWYRGKDGPAAEQVMRDIIDQMLVPDADPIRILQIAAIKVNQTLK